MIHISKNIASVLFVDLMVAGCQKGLMVPPGLSFVFANERAPCST